MHRNTFILVALLAVFAALLAGVNIGRSALTPEASQTVLNGTPTPAATPTISLISYENDTCGVRFSVPETFHKVQALTGGTMFINPADTSRSVTLLCQKTIPLTLVASASAEPYTVGSISGKLYRPASESGQVSDTLIFTNPSTAMQVMIAAPESLLNSILTTLSLQ